MTSRNPQEKLDWLRAAACITVDLCVSWPWYVNVYGYGQVNYRGQQLRAHAVVCEMVHGPRPKGAHAAHSCGRRDCVSGRHLRWATPRENAADQLVHGTRNLGERHGIAKLTTDEVMEIRRRVADGESQRSVARSTGVSKSTVNIIVNRKTWSHV